MSPAWLMVPALVATAPAAEPTAADYAADARALEHVIADNYAYLDRLPGGIVPTSPALAAERDAVRDRKSLIRHAENMLAALADHHAITGASLKDSWAVVPSYADLWIERRGEAYVVDAVRAASPAAAAGIRPGDRLVAVGGVPIDRAVADFWSALDLAPTEARAGYAARVLAAGRRDRPRRISVAGADGAARQVELASLYTGAPARPPVTLDRTGGAAIIRINDSLGDDATIAAFDAAMASLPRRAPVTIDLTDTPGGGNTTVARAMLGWFVTRPTAYQVHSLPAEARRTGIARQWVEQVLPRAGKYHGGRVTVRVGRWTGSMGEGLAIAFDTIGARVTGDRMAGLLGAIYDFELPRSGLVVKLPAERLSSVKGVPREAFVPRRR